MVSNILLEYDGGKEKWTSQVATKIASMDMLQIAYLPNSHIRTLMILKLKERVMCQVH